MIELNTILAAIRQQKPCSVTQLRRYLVALNIQPLGARQRPQRYPADAPERILAHLGFQVAGQRIVTLRELKAAKRKGAK